MKVEHGTVEAIQLLMALFGSIEHLRSANLGGTFKDFPTLSSLLGISNLLTSRSGEFPRSLRINFTSGSFLLHSAVLFSKVGILGENLTIALSIKYIEICGVYSIKCFYVYLCIY